MGNSGVNVNGIYTECYLVLFIESCTYVHQNIISELVYCRVLLRI